VPEETDALGQGIRRAIDYLHRSQLPNGEFPIHAGPDRALAHDLRPDSSPSTAAFAAYAARFVDDPVMSAIYRRCVDFLADEMEGPGLWSFWTKRVRRTIAADLDDTAWISVILRDHHPHIRFGANIGVFLMNLDARGRFRTFVRRPGADNDVDSVVNANVLFYLGEREETRPARDFVNETILGDREAGSYAYYVDHLALYYAASRAFFAGVTGLGAARGAMIAKVLARRDGSGGFDDELATAFALCTLLNLGYDDRDVLCRAAGTLVARQRADGSWPISAVFAGPEPPAAPSIWWGSDEFTTALCHEALARYRGMVGG
jgi:hypothetical protein